MLKVQSPKTSKQLPVFVDQHKMDLLLDQVDFGKEYEGVRDKMILELFYATGMRLSELVNLEETDIDLRNCQIKVLGKRNKERIIPFTNVLMDVIVNYLEK